MSLPLSPCGRPGHPVGLGRGRGGGRQAAWRTRVQAGVGATRPRSPGPQVSGSSVRAAVVSAGLSPSADSLVGAEEPPATRCQPCALHPQLFRIDTPGCAEAVRERKAWPPALLQAGPWDPPPPQVRTEGECPAPRAPATLPSGQRGSEAFPGSRRLGQPREQPVPIAGRVWGSPRWAWDPEGP